jgi:hypothetical protein
MKHSVLLSMLAGVVTLGSAVGLSASGQEKGHSNFLSKRKAETNATLYAYGTDVSAWPIAYSYSDSTSSNVAVVQNLN